ncbi:MAG: formate dehydrogenase accessory sulfurtransferase FdhD [Planctomycetota bacterium]
MKQDEEQSPNSTDQPRGATTRHLKDGDDQLVREEPLWIEVRDSRLLTLRTPGCTEDDEELALGFLLGEGVLTHIDEVTSIRFFAGDTDSQRPDTVRVGLQGGANERAVGRLSRTHEVRPSCGLCGLTDLDVLLEDFEPLLPGIPKLDLVTVEDIRTRFLDAGDLFRATGANHTAALFDTDGRLLTVGEDVGRHNALDKAIGRALRERLDLTRTVAMLSGRAGYDLILKCLRARIPTVLSVSAPSALAFDVCERAGATLIGFVREDRAKVYTDSGRLVDSSTED